VLTPPFGELIGSMARGICEAQLLLDRTSIELARLLARERALPSAGRPKGRSLLELGFRPTCYRLVDPVIEIRAAFSITEGIMRGSGRDHRVCGAHVDAGYAARFQYSAEEAGRVRTRLATLPPPGGILRTVVGAADPAETER
jgi:hypothetical protein